jgi:plasmid stability protein
VATITIRNLDESVETRLRIRAASHDRSMEEEARAIPRMALQVGEGKGGLGTLIHKRFMATGGAELRLPERRQRPRKADIPR